MTEATKIVMYNVNGLGNYNKRREVFNFLHSKKYDITCLQETHSTRRTQKLWEQQWGGKIWFSHGNSNAHGVVIAIAKNVDIKVHNINRDSIGRFIALYVSCRGLKLVLANIYAPYIDNVDFFKDTFASIICFQPDHFIVSGDFNLTLDNKMDRKGSFTNHSHSAE